MTLSRQLLLCVASLCVSACHGPQFCGMENFVHQETRRMTEAAVVVHECERVGANAVSIMLYPAGASISRSKEIVVTEYDNEDRARLNAMGAPALSFRWIDDRTLQITHDPDAKLHRPRTQVGDISIRYVPPIPAAD